MDSTVNAQPRPLIGRRSRKDVPAATGVGMENEAQGGSPASEQDSGILDVDEEEDDEVGLPQSDAKAHLQYSSPVS